MSKTLIVFLLVFLPVLLGLSPRVNHDSDCLNRLGLVPMHAEQIGQANALCIAAVRAGIVSDPELCGIVMSDVMPREIIEDCAVGAYGESWYFLEIKTVHRVEAMLRFVKDELIKWNTQLRLEVERHCRPDTFTGECSKGVI